MNSELALKYAALKMEEINDGTMYTGNCPDSVTFLHKNRQYITTMVANDRFLHSDYNGPLKEFHDTFAMIDSDNIIDRNYIYNIESVSEKDSYKDQFTRFLLNQVGISNWIHNKQIFEFSDEMCKSFMSMYTDKECTCKAFLSNLKYLPFSSFVIDFTDNTLDFLTDMRSFLVHIVFNGDKLTLFLNALTVYKSKPFQKVDSMLFDFDIANEERYNETIVEFGESKPYDMIGINHKVVFLIFQILMYLVSSKPDVEISVETRDTYRRPKSNQDINKVKNKFREIQKWDVGFRYAESVKKHHDRVINEDNHSGRGAAKKPHIRRAHWHHYWCGSGNKRYLVLKWLTEIPVNMEFHSDLILVGREEG